MKIDRLIGILSILLQQEKVTAPFLAEKFEVSKRTINRDIESLCQAGIPLVTTQGHNGGISIMEGFKIEKTLLTSADLQAILTGLRSLDSVSGTSRYSQLMEKLSPGASDLIAGDQHILINLASWSKEALSDKIELIHGAIECSRLLQFTYCTQKGESLRRVEPYDLIFQWSSWYLWGFCLDRQDFRLFKLGRMWDTSCMEVQYEKRAVPVPNLSTEKIFPGKYQVKAVFDKDCKWRLMEEYGAGSFEEKDGKLLFSAGFTDKNTIIGWILGFGLQAELLEPEEIRNELYAIGKKLCERYGN